MTAATHFVGRPRARGLGRGRIRGQLRPWVAVVGSISWSLFLGRLTWMAVGG